MSEKIEVKEDLVFPTMKNVLTPDDSAFPSFNITKKLVDGIQAALPEYINDDGTTEELSIYLLGRPSEPHLPIVEVEKARLVMAWILDILPTVMEECLDGIKDPAVAVKVAHDANRIMDAITRTSCTIGSYNTMGEMSEKINDLFDLLIDAVEEGTPATNPSMWALFYMGAAASALAPVSNSVGVELSDSNYERFVTNTSQVFEHLNIDDYRDDLFALIRGLMKYDTYGVEILEIKYRDTQPFSSQSVLKIPATTIGGYVQSAKAAETVKNTVAAGDAPKGSIFKDDFNSPIKGGKLDWGKGGNESALRKNLDDYYWSGGFGSKPSYVYSADPEKSYNMITERLAIGSAESRTSKKFKAILSAVSMGEFQSYHARNHLPQPGTKVLHCPMGDGIKGIGKHLDRSRRFIAKNIQYGPVLIHCAAGISRSVSHTIAYLVSCGLSIQDAFNLIKRGRNIANPYFGFIEEIAAFYNVELPKKLINQEWGYGDGHFKKSNGTW